MLDDRIEILINRRLDGELTDEESLELDKLLIRTPDARCLFEEYARIDQRAAEVIQAVVNRAEPSPVPEIAPATGSRRRPWYSFVMVSAMAAAVTLVFLLSQRTATLVPPRIIPTAPDQQFAAAPPIAKPPVQWATTVEGARRQTDTVETEVIGVWDRESRSLYLLEADSAGSTVEPVKFNY